MTAPTSTEQDELTRIEARAAELRARLAAQQELQWVDQRAEQLREFLGPDSTSTAAASNGHAPAASEPDASSSSSAATDPGAAQSQSRPEDLGRALGTRKLGRFVGGAMMAVGVLSAATGWGIPLAVAGYMWRRNSIAARAKAVQNVAPEMTTKEAKVSASRGGVNRTVGGGLAALGAGGAGIALLAGASVASAGFIIPAAAAAIGAWRWKRGRARQRDSVAAHTGNADFAQSSPMRQAQAQDHTVSGQQTPESQAGRNPAQTRDQIKKGLRKGAVARTVGTALIVASPFLGVAGFATLAGGLYARSVGKDARNRGLQPAGMSEDQAQQVGRKAPVRRTLGVVAMGLGAVMAARSAPGVASKLPGLITAGIGAFAMKSGRDVQREAGARATGTTVNARAGEAAESPTPPPAPTATPRRGPPTRVTGARPQSRAAGWGIRQPGRPTRAAA